MLHGYVYVRRTVQHPAGQTVLEPSLRIHSVRGRFDFIFSYCLIVSL
nr:MAG TPA: hypothetical protein [Bacteriophage sp.]